MDKPESLLSFYRSQLGEPVLNREDQEPFRIFDFDDCLSETDVQYRRRDFFKIALMEGKYLYHYADRTMEVSGSTLMFFSPDVPYKFEVLSEQAAGMFFIFREEFFTERYKIVTGIFPRSVMCWVLRMLLISIISLKSTLP